MQVQIAYGTDKHMNNGNHLHTVIHRTHIHAISVRNNASGSAASMGPHPLVGCQRDGMAGGCQVRAQLDGIGYEVSDGFRLSCGVGLRGRKAAVGPARQE